MRPPSGPLELDFISNLTGNYPFMVLLKSSNCLEHYHLNICYLNTTNGLHQWSRLLHEASQFYTWYLDYFSL